MPTRIALTFGEDKTQGVANIRARYNRFKTNHLWEEAPTTVSQADLDEALGQIWDTVKSGSLITTIKASITNDYNLADNEQIAVMYILVVGEIINQYRAQLPGGTGGGP